MIFHNRRLILFYGLRGLLRRNTVGIRNTRLKIVVVLQNPALVLHRQETLSQIGVLLFVRAAAVSL